MNTNSSIPSPKNNNDNSNNVESIRNDETQEIKTEKHIEANTEAQPQNTAANSTNDIYSGVHPVEHPFEQQSQPRVEPQSFQNNPGAQNTQNSYNAKNTQSFQNPYQQQNNYGYQNPYRQQNPGYNPYQQQNSYQQQYNGQAQYAQAQPAAPAKPKKEKRYATKGFVAGMVCLAIVLSGAVGVLGGALSYRMMSQNAPIYGSSGGNTVIYKSADSLENTGNAAYAVSQASSVASKTVVEITTETVSTNSYFGNYITDGAGSGVIISEDGYIITCAHVVDGATNIMVTLHDGTEYNAELVGSDSQTDIAIIKINVTNLPCATIGDSEQLVVGEPVVAIGNPLGELGGTVTDGIISALDRDVEIDGTTYTLLQTNAAINPGNSGGGLFNLSGELIGVVNAKSAGSSIEGLGFAIPIDHAISIAEQLIDYGYIKGRPAMGVTVLEINKDSDPWDIRSYYPGLMSYIDEYGLYIVTPDADNNFKYGDRIIAVDGITVSTNSALKSLLYEHSVGDTVKITISRLNSRGMSQITEFELTLKELTPTTNAEG